jgi:hypothetical protein
MLVELAEDVVENWKGKTNLKNKSLAVIQQHTKPWPKNYNYEQNYSKCKGTLA